MLTLFRAFTDRLKALFITNLAREIEVELLTADAERQAHLHRVAAQYETDGLAIVAEQLRRKAQSLDPEKPLGMALAPAAQILGHLTETVNSTAVKKPANLIAPPPARPKKGR